MKTELWNPRGQIVIVEAGAESLKMARAQAVRGKCVLHAVHVGRVDAASGLTARDLEQGIRAVRGRRLPLLVYLPRQMATIRLMEFPSLDPVEIADMVDLQAARQTPYSRDEIACDYRIVGTAREGYTAVMLAIVQKSVLRQRFYVFEEAGLEINRMTVATEGLLSWHLSTVPQDERLTSVVVLDVDRGATEMLLLEASRPVFARNLMIGADLLLSEPDEWKSKLLEEVRRSIEACRSERPNFQASKVILTGGAVGVPGIADWMREALNLETECRDTLQIVAGSQGEARAAVAKGISLTAIAAFGAKPSEVELSFAPETFAMRKELVRKARSLAALTSLVMTCMVAGSAFGLLALFDREYRLRTLEQELSSMESEAKKVESMLDVVRVTRLRMKDRAIAMSAIGEAHRAAVSANVLLEKMSFDIKGGEAQFEGSGTSWQDVRSFVTGLDQSAVFRGVQEEGSSALDQKTGRYRFRINCTLER